ncbi:hypothetical protein KR018_005855 [Drosophila ironensis]|nr:hypothetical protein KR018_005855 [Drosophila ironensis]
MTKVNKTPQKAKETSENASLTPVRYLDSPRQSSPPKNLEVKARLDSLVKQLQDNYAKWQLAQQRGTSICYTIEARKDKALADSVSYPDDLILPCNKLAIIAPIFGDIAKNTKEILRQLRALSKLPGFAEDAVYYRSWKLAQFVSFAKELAERYQQESIVKKDVAENIAHATKRSQLIAHTTYWEYPQHVDSYVDLGFLILAEEISLN